MTPGQRALLEILEIGDLAKSLEPLLLQMELDKMLAIKRSPKSCITFEIELMSIHQGADGPFDKSFESHRRDLLFTFEDQEEADRTLRTIREHFGPPSYENTPARRLSHGSVIRLFVIGRKKVGYQRNRKILHRGILYHEEDQFGCRLFYEEILKHLTLGHEA